MQFSMFGKNKKTNEKKRKMPQNLKKKNPSSFDEKIQNFKSFPSNCIEKMHLK